MAFVGEPFRELCEVTLQGRTERLGQGRDAIFSTLTLAHDEFTADEIDVLHPDRKPWQIDLQDMSIEKQDCRERLVLR